ncbi:hypothetical protein [Streptococcus loxodontisalivarius]|uniref:ABC-type transport system involved in multi-copper enzyme maturation permease subunit n=1 Tax=Streptococcus loxodontisalivarius TaxID=1349415 RepID=A0ABS2PVN2_9STRE|nr:hypothetical protein [Streptococcus loxodontisalivarius]MBM7643357.1 ABC-type transport system involved in multi-copper enzyme maturation permease subunit [Streptococcus loxodontisalivarius]
MTLFSSVFTSVFKRRDVKILLAFSLLPLILPGLSGVMDAQMSDSGTNSLFSFLLSMLELQYLLILPSLMIGLIVSSVFRDEISSGILFLYKDIKRSKIVNVKLLSLFAVYAIYALATSLVALVTYFFYIVPQYGFHLLPSKGVGSSFLYLITIAGNHLILIVLTAALSIKRSTLVAVLAGILYNLFAMTAPMLNGIRYLFPNSYPTKLVSSMPFGLLLIISLGLTLLYIGLGYLSARKNFNKIEF